jgi:prolyl-tRNA synthetase
MIDENIAKKDNKEILFLSIKSTKTMINNNLAISSLIWHIDVFSTLFIPIKYPFNKEVNETKLRNILKVDDEHLVPKAEEDDGICYGFIGPVGFTSNIKTTFVYDKSLENEAALVAGANKKDYHLTGVNFKRDVKVEEFVDVAKVSANDTCVKCGKPTLKISNGIEVGNIFKLGKKYTSAMGMTYLDENGKAQTPIMGCYGIGVGRLMASVLEAKADDRRVNWPANIAPYNIHICPLDYTKNDGVKAITDELYEKLEGLGYNSKCVYRDIDKE